MPKVQVFALIAKFDLRVGKEEFPSLYEYLFENGYDIFYEPEMFARGMTLKFPDATVSIQNKRGIIWLKTKEKKYEQSVEIAERVEKIIAEFHYHTSSDGGRAAIEEVPDRS